METEKSLGMMLNANRNGKPDCADMPNLSQTAIAVRNRYGDVVAFQRTFGVANQIRFTDDARRCVLGNAPTLLQVGITYGDTAVVDWFTYQLADLSEYFGGRDKITIGQVDELSRLMAQECRHMKITAMMLFFRRVKTGRYGKFYGAVDPIQIMDYYREFRREAVDIIESDERQRQTEHAEQIKRAATPMGEIRRRMDAGQYPNLKRFFDGEGDYNLLRDR